MGTITISGNDYSVYSETADPIADTKIYFNAKIGGEIWTDAGKDLQRQALVSAQRWVTRALSALLVSDDDIPDPADIPADQNLREAVYESAFDLIEDPTASDSQTQADNKKKVKAGSAEIEFFRPTSGAILEPTANSLLMRFINSLGIITNFGALASGTDGESEFCDQDKFGKTDGFP